ncbi:hypothetical protein E1A91_D05G129500v1 [Gossypium mustelinum]|uniref:Uncharacterized protein n=1 Tax=Gossypium mustelinum TaxID=34275 RepID=A0A5D2UUS4_GOSMU|nr:hypothetical protein E1A91_D05G129500v1 [Gossypium mustelinum]
MFSSWICSKHTKNLFVKIVHPGGHVELHDRPILAAEIIYRNPRCVVAYPHVFQQPCAIVAPETELMLGQKFYVVPISTIRKLQRLSNKYSPSPTPTRSKYQQSEESQDPVNDDSSTRCWFFTNKNNKIPYSSLSHSLEDEDSSADSSAEKGVPKGMEKEDGSCFDDKSCFACLMTGAKSSHDHHKACDGDDSAEKTRSPGNVVSADHDDQTRLHTRKRARGHAKGSPKRRTSFDQWQPSLASITETEE